MLKLNGSVNCGFCQGIIAHSAVVIAKNVLRIDVSFHDSKINPKTGRRNKYTIGFIAKDEIAEKIGSRCDEGSLILLSYHLATRFRFNKNVGVGRFEEEFVIDDFFIRKREKGEKMQYLNSALYQCKVLGISKRIGKNEIYRLDTAVDDSDTRKRITRSFTVFSSYGKALQERLKSEQPIMVEYKLECYTIEHPDGGKENFVNCVVERII